MLLVYIIQQDTNKHIFGFESRYNCTFMDIRERTRVPCHTPPAMDMELDQPSLLPELSLSSQGAFSRWSSHSMVTASRNSMTPDAQHLPEHANGAILYGVSQRSGSRIQCAQDLHVTTAANSCSYLTSPYGNHNQHLPSPRNGLIGNPADTYARNSHFIEGGFPYKRRFSEGFPVSFQGPNSSASFESLNAPFNSIHGYARSHLIRGDIMVQHQQPANNALWLDHPVNFNFEDRSTWTWNQAPAGFPIHGIFFFFILLKRIDCSAIYCIFCVFLQFLFITISQEVIGCVVT